MKCAPLTKSLEVLLGWKYSCGGPRRENLIVASCKFGLFQPPREKIVYSVRQVNR